MNVLLTKSFFPEDLDYISKRLLKGINLIIPASFEEQSLVQIVPGVEVFFGSLVTENILKAATDLKFIQIPWTGVENLDFDLLQKYNVVVCNSHSNSSAVAEHAVALMMDAAKKLSYHDRLLRQGKWNRLISNQLNTVSPFSSLISNSKVGIIGFGAIGKRIYEILKGFNCTFKAFTKDKLNSAEEIEHLLILPPSEIINELHELKFVFVTVPLTKETFRMVNKKFLSSMSTDAVLINISRGEIVEEEDLFKALQDNTISFAAIDTWFNYPTRNNPEVFPSTRFNFHLLDNIILSPHRAGYVKEGLPHLDDAIENLNRFYLGKQLINKVSLIDRY